MKIVNLHSTKDRSSLNPIPSGCNSSAVAAQRVDFVDAMHCIWRLYGCLITIYTRWKVSRPALNQWVQGSLTARASKSLVGHSTNGGRMTATCYIRGGIGIW